MTRKDQIAEEAFFLIGEPRGFENEEIITFETYDQFADLLLMRFLEASDICNGTDCGASIIKYLEESVDE